MKQRFNIGQTALFTCDDSNSAETFNFFISKDDYENLITMCVKKKNLTRKYARVYGIKSLDSCIIKYMHEGLTDVLHVTIRLQKSLIGRDYIEIRVKSTDNENNPTANHSITISEDIDADCLLSIRRNKLALLFDRLQ